MSASLAQVVLLTYRNPSLYYAAEFSAALVHRCRGVVDSGAVSCAAGLFSPQVMGGDRECQGTRGCERRNLLSDPHFARPDLTVAQKLQQLVGHRHRGGRVLAGDQQPIGYSVGQPVIAAAIETTGGL